MIRPSKRRISATGAVELARTDTRGRRQLEPDAGTILVAR